MEQSLAYLKERQRRAVRRLVERGVPPAEALAAVEARTGAGDDGDDFGFGFSDDDDEGGSGGGDDDDADEA